jgi:Family of unknown function (DUF5691)
MEVWQQVIDTALIGTEKKPLASAAWPPGMQAAADTIAAAHPTDREEQFLQTAAVAGNYRHAGATPLFKEGIMLPMAPAEEKPYCNAVAAQALKDVLLEDNTPLLHYWLQHCAAKGQIALPETLPALLSAGVAHKSLHTLVALCTGKRGEWLAQFNEAWLFSANQTPEQLWQTGTPEQRHTVLASTRKTDPTLALQWLQQTWAAEDAATKTALLETMAADLSKSDMPFLESLAAEKSKKVKEAALGLLKRIPESAIVQQYVQALQNLLVPKKEKTMLGLSSKMVLDMKTPIVLDAALYTSGIEKLSSSKAYSDDEHILYQLIQSAPPAQWLASWAMEPKAIIQLFQQDALGKKLIPALAAATIQFSDTVWAMHLAEHGDVFYTELLPLLPLPQQALYSQQYFSSAPDPILRHALQSSTEWSRELAQLIFGHIAKSPYQYNRGFISNIIHLIPGAVMPSMDNYAPAQEDLKKMWQNTTEHCRKLMTIKTQIIQAFNR